MPGTWGCSDNNKHEVCAVTMSHPAGVETRGEEHTQRHALDRSDGDRWQVR